MCVVALCCTSIKHLFPLEMFLCFLPSPQTNILCALIGGGKWGEGDPLMDTAGSKREITVYMYSTYMQQSQDSDALL